MTRIAALLWLVIVLAAAAYLAMRVSSGLTFRTDLLALLPREAQDPTVQHANDAVTEGLSRQVILLVGAADRDAARMAATTIAGKLTETGYAAFTTDGFEKDQLQRIGALYFPYRLGLLSERDRLLLSNGKAEDVAKVALSQVYGLAGMADAHLLRRDPFLLLPAFLTGLPLPQSRLAVADGVLSVRDGDTTWIFLAGSLNGDPYSLDFQAGLSAVLAGTIAAEQARFPGLQVLRLGAVFFASAGAKQAMHETSTIGSVSTIGAVLLVLIVFRALRPLALSLLAIGIGVLVAISACLWLVGELHVLSLLFGVSLIGVTVDYSLQYLTEAFAPEGGMPEARLRRVFFGISLATATVMIGYGTLLIAPFPGLRQIAALSVTGLFASWMTIVLWFPALDSTKPKLGTRSVLQLAGQYLALRNNRSRPVRIGLVVIGVLVVVAGFWRLRTDDDVRRLQSLSGELRDEQQRVQSLVGASESIQFFLVEAPDDEAALQSEEALLDRLGPLVGQGVLAGFQAPAQYVPSMARQRENRELVGRTLAGKVLDDYIRQLGLTELNWPAADESGTFTLAEAMTPGVPLGFLSSLVFDEGGSAVHVVKLDDVQRIDVLRSAAEGLPGVRLVDPVGDFSALLGEYRNRTILLLALSAAMMAPLLAWRYGILGGSLVMLSPALAVLLAPALRSLAGAPFTFFDGMALVLVLSIGVNYSVFLAETTRDRERVTMLAVTMAACAALLSFGMLALSTVQAVHAFGTTMLVGILLAFLFSPIARAAHPQRQAV